MAAFIIVACNAYIATLAIKPRKGNDTTGPHDGLLTS
jgi:hypothetical protein